MRPYLPNMSSMSACRVDSLMRPTNSVVLGTGHKAEAASSTQRRQRRRAVVGGVSDCALGSMRGADPGVDMLVSCCGGGADTVQSRSQLDGDTRRPAGVVLLQCSAIACHERESATIEQRLLGEAAKRVDAERTGRQTTE